MENKNNFVSRFKYIRIQGRELIENTMYAAGVFAMFRDLIKNDVLDEEDRGLFEEIDNWFSNVLPYPPQCKNQERVVCFFKAENTEEMLHMIYPALWLLDKYHHPYFVVYTNTLPGNIVYEDEYQVVVEVTPEIDVKPVPKSWTPEGK